MVRDIPINPEITMRKPIFAALLLALATPVAAQNPDGWQIRPDRANAAVDQIRFATMGDGLHVTTGPSAILYNPTHAATGAYRAHATFTQMRASQHPEAYGLIVGGKNLDGASQDYLYFVVRQDGKFLIKHRAGAETHTLVDWTAHPAVKAGDAQGKATNALAVEARPEGVRFLANGTEVAKLPRAPMVNTDGIVGLRVNHNLDVHVADFGVDPLGT